MTPRLIGATRAGGIGLDPISLALRQPKRRIRSIAES
jgi:hypothetical protein